MIRTVPPHTARRWFLAGSALACLAGALAAPEPARAAASKKPRGPVVTLYSEPGGERFIDADQVRFVYYMTTYRQRHAPKSESPTGQRVEVVNDRHECSCVRLADYSKIKFSKIREIEISYPPGSRVARVRVTRMDGRLIEYPASDLYNGGGQFPPRFSIAMEGAHREFVLIQEADAPADSSEERLTRLLLVRAPPPPHSRSHGTSKP